MRKLTWRQENFIVEYLKDYNGAAAARRAGYSKKTAKQIAYENLRKDYLKEIIDSMIKEIFDYKEREWRTRQGLKLK